MQLRIIIFIALFSMVASTTEASGYIKRGSAFLNSVGYYNNKVQNGIYSVGYSGNKHSSYEEINDFILLRSAEVTLEEGYKYFIVAGREYLGTTQSVTIECFKEYPKDTPVLIYDAGQISTNLRSKHHLSK